MALVVGHPANSHSTNRRSIHQGSEVVHAEQGEREAEPSEARGDPRGQGRCEQRARMTIPGKPDDE